MDSDLKSFNITAMN
ncbi:Protein of unknown function [Lactobacillus helveticus CIRM-BIA 101]|uniref:Uncharacterized protein n=2 Tax=Lactobacillus helveticus TaxID=1587 RepID=U6FE46_LACHE|nr:Protein of unknown function [Lactobacillus helveticus CIRM-BIA 951]CDI60836.1 Protein of unknown function [Lactobacillus helveticus CIRM-BIA 104]CDI63031.1 Protein of unknown function [Lactobacillus helveticus CIRM-BIA 103]CDI64469.1 Protein of unknown function [Lactobacillus helveticus CIRM-BIA 101]